MKDEHFKKSLGWF